MKKYMYRARNPGGRFVEGIIPAEDANTVFGQLTEDKLTPLVIREVVEKKFGVLGKLFAAKIKNEDIIVFTRQLATMLKAGIPLMQTLEILQNQNENKSFKNVLVQVCRSLTAGSRLSEALAEFPRIFTQEYVSIVISGETGADMVKALISIAQWMERESEIRAAIKTALRYPIMVVIALLVAVVVMLTFVIPKFALFFAGSTIPLPLPTRILLGANYGFQHYWPVLLVLSVVIGAGGVYLMRIKSVRLQVDKAQFHLHIIGPVYTKIVVARFGRIFAMLVRNGVPVLRTMEIAASVVANTYFQHLLINVRKSIQDGNTIADSFFNEMHIFPPMVTSLIAVGEKTGSLDDMLEQIVDFYDTEINYAMKNMTTMIEPILTAVIGVGVLFLALSILLPIWNMSQVLTNKAQ